MSKSEYRTLCVTTAICLVLLGSIALLASPVLAATTMIVDPSSVTTIVGEEFTVRVNVTDVTDLYGWEFQLFYDPSVLDLKSYDYNITGALNLPQQAFQTFVNETGGHLWFAVSTTYPTSGGVSYSTHAIFEATFEAIATGSSDLDLDNTVLSDSSANAIDHTATDGTVNVGSLDLTVTDMEICNMYANETWTHSIYANDTYSDAVTPYYYPVNVTIANTGTLTASDFKVKLEVYYDVSLEASDEKTVTSLAGGVTIELTFSSVFHPTKTGVAGRYSLKAMVDSEDSVVEDNEANNDLAKNDFMVTVMGDINEDRVVNILDGVRLSLAWTATPGASNWNVAADLNHDNAINILDGSRISLHWGEAW